MIRPSGKGRSLPPSRMALRSCKKKYKYTHSLGSWGLEDDFLLFQVVIVTIGQEKRFLFDCYTKYRNMSFFLQCFPLKFRPCLDTKVEVFLRVFQNFFPGKNCIFSVEKCSKTLVTCIQRDQLSTPNPIKYRKSNPIHYTPLVFLSLFVIWSHHLLYQSLVSLFILFL